MVIATQAAGLSKKEVEQAIAIGNHKGKELFAKIAIVSQIGKNLF